MAYALCRQVGFWAESPLAWTTARLQCNIFKAFRTAHLPKVAMSLGGNANVEVTKALAALEPLYGKDNVEIVTLDGQRVRGIVRSMKTTQALTTPSVKMECANGEIVKIPFPTIAEIKDHNSVGAEQ